MNETARVASGSFQTSRTDLERVLIGREQFDLVISDVCLRGPSGLDVARRARRAGLETPFIFLSEHQDDSTAAAVADLGGAVLLPKALERDDLVAAIRQWLGPDPRGQR